MFKFTLSCNFFSGVGSCGSADSVMDSHTTGPGLNTQLVRYFLANHHSIVDLSNHWCVNGWGRISWLGLTQDIKMGSCIFQCDIPHQWIAQRQVGPMSVYCDEMGCCVLCLRHAIPVWQHIGQNTTATRRHCHDMTSDV